MRSPSPLSCVTFCFCASRYRGGDGQPQGVRANQALDVQVWPGPRSRRRRSFAATLAFSPVLSSFASCGKCRGPWGGEAGTLKQRPVSVLLSVMRVLLLRLLSSSRRVGHNIAPQPLLCASARRACRADRDQTAQSVESERRSRSRQTCRVVRSPW